MAQFASGESLTLTRFLAATDVTLFGDSDLGVSTGRIFLQNDSQVEWIKYTGKSVSGVTLPNGNPEYQYTGLVRGLSKTADPITGGTGQSWLATSIGKLVIMHDQMSDKNLASQIHQEALTFATEATRDTALGGNGVCLINYTDIKVTSTGLFYNYNTTTGQWEVQGTGTATPNASETVAGSVEIATSAQTIAGTDTGETGAKLSAIPSDIAKNTQSGTHIYAHSTDLTDTYTATFVPALTPTAGTEVRVKFDTVNTGACTLNGASIKLQNGNDPSTGDIKAGGTYNLIFDGTNYIITISSSPGTVTAAITDSIGANASQSIGTNIQATTSGFVVAGGDYVGGNNGTVRGYIGVSNPATIRVADAATQGSGNVTIASITFPVPKGYYYRVDMVQINNAYMYFIPNK